MGWSGSTYARLLGLYQRLDHGRGFHVVCPKPIGTCAVDVGGHLLRHVFCQEVEELNRQRQASASATDAQGRAHGSRSSSICLRAGRAA